VLPFDHLEREVQALRERHTSILTTSEGVSAWPRSGADRFASDMAQCSRPAITYVILGTTVHRGMMEWSLEGHLSCILMICCELPWSGTPPTCT
jgi:hypothetical protein